MKRIRKAICVIIVLTMTISAGGCWNYSESEDMVFVVGLAFDRLESGRVHVTVEENRIDGKEKLSLPVYLEAEGDTFYDAMRNAIKLAETALHYNHTQVIIISQEIANNSLGDLLDMLLRFPEIRLTMSLVVSKEATAREVLIAENPHKGLNSSDMLGSLKAEQHLGKAPYIKLYQFVGAMMGESHSGVLAAAGLSDINGQKVVEVSSAAVFSGPWLAGFLDEYDCRTFMLLYYNQNVYDLPLPADPQGKFTAASVQFYINKIDILPDFVDGKPKVDIYIQGEIVPVEISGASTDPKLFNSVANALITNTATALENAVVAFFIKTKDLNGADIVDIGSKLQATQPQLWKQINGNWRNYYKDLEVNVRADVTIRNTGFGAQPMVKGE